MRRTFGSWSLNIYPWPSAASKLLQDAKPGGRWISAWRAWTISCLALSTGLLALHGPDEFNGNQTLLVGVSSHRHKSGMKSSQGSQKQLGTVQDAEKAALVTHTSGLRRERPVQPLPVSGNGVLSERGPCHSLRCSCFSLSTVG